MKWISIAVYTLVLILAASLRTHAPELTIREIMVGHLDPAADEVWGSAGTIIDETGVHILEPKSEADWNRIREASSRIVDLSRRLRHPAIRAARDGESSRAPWAELEPKVIDDRIRKNRKRYESSAAELGTVARAILRAAARRESGALMDLGDRLQQSCDRCHSAFWYIKPLFKEKISYWNTGGKFKHAQTQNPGTYFAGRRDSNRRRIRLRRLDGALSLARGTGHGA